MRLPLFTALLAVLNILLAWAIGAQLFAGPRLKEQVQAAALAAKVPAAPELPAALMQMSFDGLQSQAVFHKSRSFFVAPTSPVAQPPPPDYRMVGLMALPNRPPSAVLLNSQSNARVRVAVGDQLDGWSVAEVTAKRVLIQLGDRTAEINGASRSTSGGMVITPGSQASAPSPGARKALPEWSGRASGVKPTSPATGERDVAAEGSQTPP